MDIEDVKRKKQEIEKEITQLLIHFLDEVNKTSDVIKLERLDLIFSVEYIKHLSTVNIILNI